MEIFFRTEYSQALIACIAQARKSITLAAMTIDARAPMDDVLTELHNALHREVKVTLYIDAFTRLSFYESLRPYEARKNYSTLLHQLSLLTQQGATIVWLGKLGANPYKRRFHQKMSIIDDEIVFFAGGINLTGESFHHHDFMLRTTDTKLAAILTSQLQRIASDHFINDETHILTARHTLLIDGGQPHTSIIYDTAMQYAAQAKEIIYVSQMAPSGKLARILTKKPTTFYLNRPTSMSPLSGISEFINQRRYQYVNHYHGKRYIHAKYMLFTMPNDDKIALTGSHNFSERGVNYGTKEIALLTKDEDIWQKLYTYTQDQL